MSLDSTIIGAVVGVVGVAMTGMVKWIAADIGRRIDHLAQAVETLNGHLWDHINREHERLPANRRR